LLSKLFNTSLSWKNLSKLQVEQLAIQLKVSAEGMLDDNRMRLKEKWTVYQDLFAF
jgi:hypothetical protein